MKPFILGIAASLLAQSAYAGSPEQCAKALEEYPHPGWQITLGGAAAVGGVVFAAGGCLITLCANAPIGGTIGLIGVANFAQGVNDFSRRREACRGVPIFVRWKIQGERKKG